MSVAVTGRGVVTSLGEGADSFFEDLIAGRSGIADGLSAATQFDPERHIEAVAAAFEADKPYLVSRWRWPDRFNP